MFHCSNHYSIVTIFNQKRIINTNQQYTAMEYICKCNKCNSLLLDTNPQVGSIKFDVDYLNLSELVDHKCPNCDVDDYLDDYVCNRLWELLGSVPVNNDDEIEEQFLHFPIGSDKLEIWLWFEETFGISVIKLMYKNKQ